MYPRTGGATERKLHSYLPAIQNLPNEILCLIFDYAVQWNDFRYTDNLTRPTYPAARSIPHLPALTFSSVCSRWRSTSVTFPILWSRLRIITNSWELEASGSRYDAYVATINLFLSRSSVSPLVIALTNHNQSKASCPPSMLLLLEHTRRWKILICDCRFDLIDDGVRDFGALEALELYPNGFRPTEVSFFQRAPKLTELRMMNPLKIPGNRIASLDVATSNGPMDRILELYPCLTTLKIHSHFGNDTTDPRTSCRVKNLVVRLTSAEDHVFPSFTFPALEQLHLFSSAFEGWKWPGDCFADFITRSSCKITELKLKSVGLSDIDLIRTLYLLSSLVTLEISDIYARPNILPITTNLIQALHSSTRCRYTSSRVPLVPRLRYLFLDSYGADFDDQAFVDMISSRWLPRTASRFTSEGVEIDCLRAVEMKFRKREVDIFMYGPLVDMDRMGLRVAVTGTNGTRI
ncbi:hypothetical protein GYMLUDRAFT_264107 [Collybiopsis luxurians FD-317 M1]|uniref:F-box domain-containing protein n=1 Tax=Collybiopsis luxurians FD-317 M1 TaxID=944289 RepID=A0A0D0BLG5_9AGAR|nr:hypothetical protein GYMLUDRAFT_264107 [Collybiopsis luxurians FD-317 M1]